MEGKLVCLANNSIVYSYPNNEPTGYYITTESMLGMYIKDFGFLESILLIKNRFFIANKNDIYIANDSNSR